MAWNPTNTNDVTLIVSVVERDDSGSRTGTTELVNTGAVVVDDFSIETEEDLEALSAIPRHSASPVVTWNTRSPSRCRVKTPT